MLVSQGESFKQTHGDAACDVLIVGGGVGGCAAAMAAAGMGVRVILTEPTDWVGGQLTSQAVPPDENPWIERFGCTASYRRFREGVRDVYRTHYPLRQDAIDDPHLNPGAGAVSGLCHEPRVALRVLETMLMPAQTAGRLQVRLRRTPVAAETRGDRVVSVTFDDAGTGRRETIAARFVLDATELGDVLALAGVEYVSGAEAQSEYGEPHALPAADPDAVQALTWCLPLAYDPRPGADHTIDRPREYDFWRDYTPDMTPAWEGKLLAWDATSPFTLGRRELVLMPEETAGRPEVESLWHYRRIVARQHYRPGAAPDEVTLVNWPHNDYWLANIIDKPADAVAHHLERARQLSLSLVHWLQTEAPRPDGGQGYPGLYLRPDMTGTDDGLAKAPYFRESRRIRAVFTVTENHVGAEARGGINTIPGRSRVQQPPGVRAEPFFDSVGIGAYRIDLHPDTAGHNYIDVSSLPFQIPLGALLPVRVRNLLPACKNIGTTHITNGCYRLHPVEWNIGEAAGFLAAYSLQRRIDPHGVRENADELRDFQQLLTAQGVELAWLESVTGAPKPAPTPVGYSADR